MRYSYAKGAWEVRWRDSNGRQRSRRFDETPAKAFDEAIHDQKVKSASGSTTDSAAASTLTRRGRDEVAVQGQAF